MSRYDNDPRVERVNDYHFVVHAPDDLYHASADTPDRWFTDPSIGGNACRAANLRTREDAEAWAVATTRGPFPSGDEAIASLIGDPR